MLTFHQMPNLSSFMRLGRLVAFLLVLATACSGDDSGTPPLTPSRLGLVTEPGQIAGSGVPLSPQPVVEVLDASGAPFAARGLLVTASLASGGGTLEGTTGIRTDQAGRAAFTDLAISGAVGPRTLRFSAVGLSAALSGTVNVGPGAATVAVVAAGNNQTVAAGTAVPVAPAVRVSDSSDNPVPGVGVTFAVTQGGGTITGGSAVTDANGVAALGRWVLGTAVGANALSVTVNGVPEALTVSATAVVGPASQITIVDGNDQVAAIGGAVPVAPAVKVTDAAGNIVAGVAITFAPASGGTVTGGTGITDATGIARVGAWRMGLTPGTNTLTAGRQGAVPATFTAIATDLQVDAIAAGGAHGCGTTSSGLLCWGDNTVAQFGNGTLASDSVAVSAGGTLVLTQVTAGTAHTCGLTSSGAAWCWGANNAGQLGDGTLISKGFPVPVTGGLTFSQISAGTTHTCAIRVDGAAYCWGSGSNGRLGTNMTTSSLVPVPVTGGFTWSSIRAGGSHTCAVRSDATLYCWGANGNGRLGDGTVTDRASPTAVLGATTWTAVAAGGRHSCGLNQAGQAFCWGNGSRGQLGGGTTVAQSVTPTAVTGTLNFTQIAAGTDHTCGLTAAGAAWCWGSNGDQGDPRTSGRLGDGTTTPQRATPTAVIGGASYTGISTGDQHTCARSSAGSAICWGRNAEGQIGDGTTVARLSPVGVTRP